MARNHKGGGQGEPHAARMGELLPSRHRQQGVSGTRQLHSDAVAPVVAVQAQNQASQGRNLSTPASLRALLARAPEQAWARRAVGEGVKFCPRAGCGKSACPVRSFQESFSQVSTPGSSPCATVWKVQSRRPVLISKPLTSPGGDSRLPHQSITDEPTTITPRTITGGEVAV